MSLGAVGGRRDGGRRGRRSRRGGATTGGSHRRVSRVEQMSRHARGTMQIPLDYRVHSLLSIHRFLQVSTHHGNLIHEFDKKRSTHQMSADKKNDVLTVDARLPNRLQFYKKLK